MVINLVLASLNPNCSNSFLSKKKQACRSSPTDLTFNS